MADHSLGRESRILIVDASAPSRTLMQTHLRKLGYTRLEYSPDNRSALRSIERNRYELVLADWDAATADGVDLLRETRTDPRLRFLPFLMAIPQWQKKFIEIVRNDGATLYLTKPFTDNILRERLDQVSSDASRSRTMFLQAKASPSPVGVANAELWKLLRPMTG